MSGVKGQMQLPIPQPVIKMAQAVRIERKCAQGQNLAGIPATHT